MKIKEIKIVNQDQSTEIADIGADAINVDYNDTTVKAELDKLNTSNSSLINTQTSQGTKLVDLQGQINGLASGSPKGTYNTVQSLISANPDTGVYVVKSDGHIYSWTKDESEAIDIGAYQVASISREISDLHFTNNVISLNIDLENITSGRSFNKTTGAIVNNKDYNITDYIPIVPNMKFYLPYRFPHSMASMCFFDKNKEFTHTAGFSDESGWGTVGFVNGGDNDYYCRLCFYNYENLYLYSIIEDLIPSNLPIPYNYEIFNESGKYSLIKIKNLSIDKSNIEKNTISPLNFNFIITNLLNWESVVDTYKRIDVDGKIIDTGTDNYFTSPFIEINSNVEHLYIPAKLTNAVFQVGFYDVNYNFINGIYGKGWANSLGDIGNQIPKYAKYLRLVGSTNDINNTALGIFTNISEQPAETIKYGDLFLNVEFKNFKKQDENARTIKTVKKDGTGDFSTIRSALNSIENDVSITIQIGEGTWELTDEFSAEEINNASYNSHSPNTSFCGWAIEGNDVIIEAIGKKENTILNCTLSDDYSSAIRGEISTLNLKGNVTLNNLTITGRNIRYAIHDDFLSLNNTMNINNCDIILYKGTGIGSRNHAYGMGTASGKITNFENCYFEPRFYQHTNHSFTKPSITTLKNCIASSEFKFDDMGSGQQDKAYLYSCIAPYITTAWYSNLLNYSCMNIFCDTDIDWIQLSGDNNVITPNIKMIGTYSNKTISANKFVQTRDRETYQELLADSQPIYGFCLDDIGEGSHGRCITKGHIIQDRFDNINATVGKKYTISNKKLIESTSSSDKIIGICDLAGYIKLII